MIKATGLVSIILGMVLCQTVALAIAGNNSRVAQDVSETMDKRRRLSFCGECTSCEAARMECTAHCADISRVANFSCDDSVEAILFGGSAYCQCVETSSAALSLQFALGNILMMAMLCSALLVHIV